MQVKQIDLKSYWVFEDPKHPCKVRLHKVKMKYRLECKCFKFVRVRVCEHVRAVMAFRTDLDFIQPKLKPIEVPEFIGGDVRQQIVPLIQRLHF